MPANARTSTSAVAPILIYRCVIRTSWEKLPVRIARISQGCKDGNIAQDGPFRQISVRFGGKLPDFRQHRADDAVAPHGVEVERLAAGGAQPIGNRLADHRA